MTMETLIYPSVDKIIEFNLLSLTFIKVKRADTAKVLSRGKLEWIVAEVKKMDGDIYDKAEFLFKNLITGHPFASGNRRTAFIVTKDFFNFKWRNI